MDDHFINLAQRITVLEAREIQQNKDMEELFTLIAEMRAAQAAEAKKITSLLTKITKWEGRFGGVVFVIGCLWAFFSGFAKAMVDWISFLGGR